MADGRQMIVVRYDPDVAKWLKQQAKDKERTLSQEIRFRLRQDMEREARAAKGKAS